MVSNLAKLIEVKKTRVSHDFRLMSMMSARFCHLKFVSALAFSSYLLDLPTIRNGIDLAQVANLTAV